MVAKKKEPEIVRPLKENPNCQRCKLSDKSLTICCPSRGPKKADIAIWGDALNPLEEKAGKPFVGDAGRKLRYLLRNAGIKRKEVKLTNIVRCRPPGTKKPSKKEIDACWPYSLYEILAGKPKVVVAMGALAAKTLLDAPVSVDKVRGFPVERTFFYEGKKGLIEHTCWVLPTVSPAACLHDWSKDDLGIFDLQTAKSLAEGHNRLVWPDTKITVANTFPEAINLIKKLKKVGEWVFDTETTGFDPHEAKILCIGFCWKAGESHILPLFKQNMVNCWTPEERRQIVEELTEAFEQSSIMGQNLKFDIKHIRALTGLTDYQISHDTLIGHRCIDENKPHNLTFQCQWYLKWAKYDSLMDQYKTGKKEFHTWEVPDNLLWKYAGYDCDGTFRVAEAQGPDLEEAKAAKAFKTEINLIVPLADVEYRGFQTDKNKLFELSALYRKQAEIATKKLKRSAKKYVNDEFAESFNPNSTKQLISLFQATGAPLTKKTASGNPSVDRLVLAKFALEKNPAGTIARNVQLLRKATKYLGTYLDGKDGTGGLLQHLKSHDRVHPTYNLGLTRTGRLSADDPPIQTIPRVGGIRNIFVPDRPDHKLIAVDYEKLELCIMAWMANDERMCNELINRVDLHTRMALTVRLNRDPSDEEFEEMAKLVGKDERALAKCFHPDTEVLTKSGWKKILDLQEGEEVAQAMPGNKGNVGIEWTVPLEVFSMPNEHDHLIHLKNEGINIKVTPDHRMLGWVKNDYWEVRYPNDVNGYCYWANAGYMGTVPPTRYKEELLRLSVATQADGHIRDGTLQFGFVKQRKIDRLKSLLEEIFADYTYSTSSGVTTFRITGWVAKRVINCLDNKSLPWVWLSLPGVLRDAVIDESQYWDSHKADNWRCFRYSSTDKQSVDVLQALCAISGRKTRLTTEKRQRINHKDLCKLTIRDRATSCGGNLKPKKIPYTGDVACLSVRSSFILVRYQGLPIISGQSVNFGIPYGRGAAAIVEASPDAFPSGMLKNQRVQKVQDIIDAYYNKYWGVQEYLERQAYDAKKKGALFTPFFNRRRNFKAAMRWFNSDESLATEQRDYDLSHLEREARNFRIQSLGSDLLSRATDRVWHGMKEVRIPCFRIVMSLHDALVYNCHKDHVDEAISHIVKWMEWKLPKNKKHKFEMPIRVDPLVHDTLGGEYE